MSIDSDTNVMIKFISLLCKSQIVVTIKIFPIKTLENGVIEENSWRRACVVNNRYAACVNWVILDRQWAVRWYLKDDLGLANAINYNLTTHLHAWI